MVGAGEPGRGEPGGIAALLDWHRQHRAAFDYDWRSRFGIPFDATTYGEAWRLTQQLLRDPSSHVAAAIAGWEHPVSAEWLVLADLYDLTMAVNAKKGTAKAYPRPWRDRSKSRPRPTVAPEVAIAALRQAGHTAALPKRLQHYESAPQGSTALEGPDCGHDV